MVIHKKVKIKKIMDKVLDYPPRELTIFKLPPLFFENFKLFSKEKKKIREK